MGKNVSMMNDKELIGIGDIEKIILLADDVLVALLRSFWDYSESGEDVFNRVYNEHDPAKDANAFHEAFLAERFKNREHEELLGDILRDEKYDFDDVHELTADELMEMLAPILQKAVGIMRHGTSQGDTQYAADESISDDYLKRAFAMRVRDRMILLSAQRLQEKEKRLYLLTWGDDSCHDMYEWVGVFDNVPDLHRAYEAALSQSLISQRCERLMIYEFEGNTSYKEVKPKDLWGCSF